MKKILKFFSLVAVFLGIMILAACDKDSTGIVGELSCETTRNSIEVTAEFEQNEKLSSGSAKASVKLFDAEEQYKNTKSLSVSNGISGKVTFDNLEFDTKYILKLFVSLDGIEEELDSIEATTKNTGDTAETAIEISTVEQFLNIENDKEAYYKLVADLDFSEKTSVRISKSGNAFKGSLDGNGHKISNVKLATDNEYAGLFGFAQNATFKNITLENVTLENSSVTIKVFGSLVGYAENVTIDNVNVKNSNVSVTGKTNTGQTLYGGLVGRATTTGNKKTIIENCSVEEATITFKEFRATKDTSSAVGLFAGLLEGNTTVDNCYVEATTSVNYKYSNPGVLNVGGFVGICNSADSIKNSYAISEIEVVRVDYAFTGLNVGGFAGANGSGNMNIDGVFAKSDITIVADKDEEKATSNKLATNTNVGGLFGKVVNSSRGIKNAVYAAKEAGIKVVGKTDDKTFANVGLVYGELAVSNVENLYAISDLLSASEGMTITESTVDASMVSVLPEALQAKINE